MPLPANLPLALLACPVCHGTLEAPHERNTSPSAPGEEPSAFISCSSCKRRYPLSDGIPILIAGRSF